MQQDINALWNIVLPALEKSLTRPIYETLASSAKPLSIDKHTFIVAVPNDVIRQWLSKHCLTLIEQEARNLNDSISRVEFVVGSPDIFSTPDIEKVLAQKPKENQFYGPEPAKTISPPDNAFVVSPRYTFETFVVGHGNRFAQAASLAVAESPATAYNPLFLYGGVGLGKTHLMQAIGNYILKKKPKAKVLYTSSESFTNDLIDSIRFDKMANFKSKYRNVDVLLVDDIQFIAGKERTQEEFFHTFNALYESNRQIVVSSDRPPKEIPTLEERLRSRFEWGLIADIQIPDFETRIAILKKKADTAELSVNDDILAFIASKIVSNIRELEGALIRVAAFASLNNKELSIPTADEALKEIVQGDRGKPSLTIDILKKAVAEHYGLTMEKMNAKNRTKEIVTARQVAMYLARELTNSSLPKIGEEFGGRDHTTVMHAHEKIKEARKNEPEIEDAIKSIRSSLKKFS